MNTIKQLDRNNFAPLYHQLYEILREQIDSGYWKPGDILPTEAELNEKYGVSQITTRKALDILVEAGLIYRQRGKGTFVSRKMTTSNVTYLVNFADDMHQRGFSHRTKVIKTGTVPVSKHTADQLHIEVGDELVQIERLRFADDEPISVEKTFIVRKHCPEILAHDFSTESLSEVLRQEYGIILDRAEQTIRAQSAGDELAELLNINPEDPLLMIERIAYSQNNTPIEFLRIFYRGDRYALHNELKAS